MEKPQIENMPNPEEEIGKLRNKITETFQAVGLTPKVYEAIEEWKDRKRKIVEGITNPKAILEYHIELAEIYAEIGDFDNLNEYINDLYGKNGETWESFITQIGEESDTHREFRDRLNKLLGIVDGSTEPLS